MKTALAMVFTVLVVLTGCSSITDSDKSQFAVSGDRIIISSDMVKPQDPLILPAGVTVEVQEAVNRIEVSELHFESGANLKVQSRKLEIKANRISGDGSIFWWLWNVEPTPYQTIGRKGINGRLGKKGVRFGPGGKGGAGQSGGDGCPGKDGVSAGNLLLEFLKQDGYLFIGYNGQKGMEGQQGGKGGQGGQGGQGDKSNDMTADPSGDGGPGGPAGSGGNGGMGGDGGKGGTVIVFYSGENPNIDVSVDGGAAGKGGKPGEGGDGGAGGEPGTGYLRGDKGKRGEIGKEGQPGGVGNKGPDGLFVSKKLHQSN